MRRELPGEHLPSPAHVVGPNPVSENKTISSAAGQRDRAAACKDNFALFSIKSPVMRKKKKKSTLQEARGSTALIHFH